MARFGIGWVWRYAPPPVMEPPCFQEEGEEENCCSRGIHGAGGDPNCWTDVFDYGRCCEARWGIWILPPLERAQAAGSKEIARAPLRST